VEAGARLAHLPRTAQTTLGAALAHEEALLGPLAPPARLVALAVAQPLWVARLETGTTEQRRAATGDRVESLLAQLRALFSDPPRPRAATMDLLGQALEKGGPGEQLGAAVGLGFTLDIPFSLRTLPKTSDPTVRACAAVALGMAARAGSLFAARLVLRRLASRSEPESGDDAGSEPLAEAERAAFLQGLGDGLLDDGLGWFLSAARHARRERETWTCAARNVWRVAAQIGSPSEPALRELVLRTSTGGCPPDLEEIAATLAIPPATLASDLADRWWRWPPPVRAALLTVSPSLVFDRPELWARDRSSAVGRAVLDALESSPELLSAELQRSTTELLDHGEPSVRNRALGLLARQQRRPAVSCLPPSPRGGDVVVLPRRRAEGAPLDQLREALYRGDADALPALIPEVARAAPAEAVRALVEALTIPDMAIRRGAIAALPHLGGLADVPALLDAGQRLRTLEGPVTAAIHALGEAPDAGRSAAPWEAAGEALVELFDRRLKWADDDAVDLLVGLRGVDALLPSLLRALDTRFYPAARSGAARAVGRHRVAGAALALRRLVLLDSHGDVRSDAANALVALGTTPPPTGEQAGFALAHAALGELPAAARRATEAGAQALPGLRRVLGESTWKRRHAACGALAGIPGEDAQALLLGALTDEDEDVRLAALGALEERGWAPATPREHTLAALARRDLGSLRDTPHLVDPPTVWEALGLGGHVFRSEVARFVEWAGLRPPTPAEEASLHVAQLDPTAAVETTGGLTEVLRALNRTWQAYPHRDHLAQPLRHVSPEVLGEAVRPGRTSWRAREALCVALARPGDDRAAGVLALCVEDDDDDVRAAALDSLAVIASGRAAQTAARGARSPFREDRLPVAETLAAIGEAALPTVDRLSASPWWEERQVAALALGQWRGPRDVAADRLILLAVDPEMRVSMAATEGLRTHGVPPSPAAARRAIAAAHPDVLAPLVGWLGLGPRHALDPAGAEELRAALEGLPPDALALRLGVVAVVRAESLAPWVASLLGHAHAGVRLAAQETTRALANLACHVCGGHGSVRCPACRGSGEQTCARCGGGGLQRTPCPDPDCNASATTRSIHSRACVTCRGRGWVHVACTCGNGAVRCDRCRGAGRFRCPLCDGTGAA